MTHFFVTRMNTIAAICITALSACGGGTTTTVEPASYETLDSLAVSREAASSRAFPTTAGRRPTGTLTYNGEIRITPTLGGATQDYLGRARVSVGFDDDRLTGTLSNLTSDRGFVTSNSLALIGGEMSRNSNGATILEFGLVGDIADSDGNDLSFDNAIDGGVFGLDAQAVRLDGSGLAEDNTSRRGASVPVSIELIADR